MNNNKLPTPGILSRIAAAFGYSSSAVAPLPADETVPLSKMVSAASSSAASSSAASSSAAVISAAATAGSTEGSAAGSTAATAGSSEDSASATAGSSSAAGSSGAVNSAAPDEELNWPRADSAFTKKAHKLFLESVACRYKGVTEGIYHCEHLEPFKLPPLEAQMLHHPTVEAFVINVVKNDNEFRKRFLLVAPYMARFPLAEHKMIIAGGSVSSLVMNSNYQIKDIDVFLVGHTSEESVIAAIAALFEHVAAHVAEPFVKRTANCLTICGQHGKGYVEVQVILRQYATAAEVIHGFDIGACAMMWDGSRLGFAPMGKLAAETMCIVLDLQARSNSYEFRLSKYHGRGFILYLPHLNPTFRGSALPYMYFLDWRDKSDVSYRGYIYPATSPDMQSNYEDSGDHHDPQRTISAVEAANLRKMVRTRKVLTAVAPYSAGMDLRNISNTISEATIRDEVTEIKQCVEKGLQPGIKRMLSVLGPDNTRNYHLAMAQGVSPFEDIDAIVARRFEELREVNAPGALPFRLMSVEDGTYLRGPFERTPTDVRAWYGQHYLA